MRCVCLRLCPRNILHQGLARKIGHHWFSGLPLSLSKVRYSKRCPPGGDPQGADSRTCILRICTLSFNGCLSLSQLLWCKKYGSRFRWKLSQTIWSLSAPQLHFVSYKEQCLSMCMQSVPVQELRFRAAIVDEEARGKAEESVWKSATHTGALKLAARLQEVTGAGQVAVFLASPLVLRR